MPVKRTRRKRFAPVFGLLMLALFLWASFGYWWGEVIWYQHLGKVAGKPSGIIIGGTHIRYHFEEIGWLRWYEKPPGEPWKVVYLLRNRTRWDRKIAVGKARRLTMFYVPVAKTKRIKLKPDEIRRFVFEGEGKRAYPAELGVFRTKATRSSLIGIMGGYDVQKEISPFADLLHTVPGETLRIQCSNGTCCRAKSFVLEPGEKTDVTCYLVNPSAGYDYTWGVDPEKLKHYPYFIDHPEEMGRTRFLTLKLYISPSLQVRLLDAGRASIEDRGNRFTLNYGLMPEGEIDSFRLALQAPEDQGSEGLLLLLG